MPDQQLRRLAAAARRLREAPSIEQLAAAVLDGVAELLPGHGGVFAVLADGGGYELALYRDVELAAAHALLAAPETARALAADRAVPLPASLLAPGAGTAPGAQPLAAALGAAGRRAGLLLLVPSGDGAAAADAAGEAQTPELLALLAVQAGLALDACLARRAEAAGHAHLDGVVGAVPVPLLLVAADGTLAALNALGAELFGLSPDFDRGRPVSGRLRAPELEALCLPGPEGELDVRVGSGAARRELHARVVRVGADAKVAVFHDRTAAREMERLKADFVAVVGHELRTPLTV